MTCTARSTPSASSSLSTILGLQHVRRPEDADGLKLREKSDIKLLHLRWNNEGGKSVLDRLVPPRTLEHFILVGYASEDFPAWMSNISSYLPVLSELSLVGLEACDSFPPFGALPNLRRLSLRNIPNLRNIGKEFYGEGIPCMKLRVLLLDLMENLVEWRTTESNKENEEFLIPNLHHLAVRNCPKLKFVPYPPSSMYWVLNNSEAVLPERGFGNLSSSVIPSLMLIERCSFFQDKWDRLHYFPTLEKFHLKSISGLRTLPVAMRCFTALKILNLVECEALETLPGWLGQLTCLEIIFISDCPKLTSLPESIQSLSALKLLRIVKCPSLVARCQGEDAHLICHIPTVDWGEATRQYICKIVPVDQATEKMYMMNGRDLMNFAQDQFHGVRNEAEVRKPLPRSSFRPIPRSSFIWMVEELSIPDR